MQDHRFDVSVVLNVHNETRYLKRTTRSLEEAARFARASGVSAELMIVVDAAPQDTRIWIDRYETDAFDSVEKVFVSHGSLGLARNHGARLSKGKYVRFCDADDLISYNTITECLSLAVRSEIPTIIYPEYMCYFGFAYKLYKMYALDQISKIGFMSYHPYISNIFGEKSQILSIGYGDAPLGGLVAYEDWHFAAEAVARGFDLQIAPNTVLYYRKREGSLMAQASATSRRIIDECSLFEPAAYLRVSESEGYFLENDLSFPSAQSIRDQYLRNRVAQELGLAANRIDPAIDLPALAECHAFSNKEGDLELGRAYHRICKLVQGKRFDQVALFPFVSRGGGEKYILMIIRALREARPDGNLLVVCGEGFDRAQEIDTLPDDCTLVDLAAVAERLDQDKRALLCLRLLQSTAKDAVVHMKPCPFVENFVRQYAALLSDNRLVFYRFVDPRSIWEHAWTVRGAHFDFLSEFGSLMDVIVTDNRLRAEFDTERLDDLAERYRVIPAAVDLGVPAAPFDRHRSQKLLWASRLDAQKRPELLPKLAEALQEHSPGVDIHVFGATTTDCFDFSLFDGRPNLVYRGEFSGFENLPFEAYDALIYTACFDGLPNIILESMSAGLTPIAPDIDGIGEVVTADTGFLVANKSEATELVAEYVDAIRRLYDPGTNLPALRANAHRLMIEERSWNRFSNTVRESFGND